MHTFLWLIHSKSFHCQIYSYFHFFTNASSLILPGSSSRSQTPVRHLRFPSFGVPPTKITGTGWPWWVTPRHLFYVSLNSEKQIIDIFSNVHLWSMFGFKWRTPTQQNMFFSLTQNLLTLFLGRSNCRILIELPNTTYKVPNTNISLKLKLIFGFRRVKYI